VHTLILDDGPQYTATATVLYAHELGLVPITTSSYSPESNGLYVVHTFKRDYVNVHELRDSNGLTAATAKRCSTRISSSPSTRCARSPTLG
jgi:hypothetical protein